MSPHKMSVRPKWYPKYVLGVLTLLNIANLWHRYLLYNLSAVSATECSAVCTDVPFVPLCEPCPGPSSSSPSSQADEDACVVCQMCRNTFDSVDYNLKDGACIDNTAYGYLAGFGFTLMFAVVGLFAGHCSDTLDRRLVHTTAVLLWSLAAAGHGTCSSFRCLLAARIFVGIGQAFNAPCCYTVIAYFFPPAGRATANGIYSTGTYVGAALSSLCIMLAGAIGWRSTAFLSGSFGVFIAALLYYTVDQPPRPRPPRQHRPESTLSPLPPPPLLTAAYDGGTAYTPIIDGPAYPRVSKKVVGLGAAGITLATVAAPASDGAIYGGGFGVGVGVRAFNELPAATPVATAAQFAGAGLNSGGSSSNSSNSSGCGPSPGGGDGEAYTLTAAARIILSNPRSTLLIIATSVRMIGTYVVASYLPLYYKRAFPDRINQFSGLNAGLVTVGGIISSYAGGHIADRFAVSRPGVVAWVPAAGALLGLGPMAVALYSSSFYGSVFALFLAYLVAECWLGPGMTILQRESPREVVGLGVALLLFVNTLTSNIGPVMIAAADPGTAAVRDPIFGQMALSYIFSAGLFTVLGFMLQGRRSGGRDRSASGAATGGDGGDGGDGGGPRVCVVAALRACPVPCRELVAGVDVTGAPTSQEMEGLMASIAWDAGSAAAGTLAVADSASGCGGDGSTDNDDDDDLDDVDEDDDVELERRGRRGRRSGERSDRRGGGRSNGTRSGSRSPVFGGVTATEARLVHGNLALSNNNGWVGV